MTPHDTPIPVHDDPFTLFHSWLAEAETTEPSYANAMTLATADANGRPSARIVLLRDSGPDGFVYYTNARSHKGRDVAANPFGAVCFYWKSIEKQVRAEGPIAPIDPARSDAYFAARPYRSRIAALASDQSEPMEDRAVLLRRMDELMQRYPEAAGVVPRPDHWHGFCLQPSRIEFWHEREFRIHHRLEYRRDAQTPSGWRTAWLFP